MTDLVVLDTNVWVHAVDAADARKRLRALEVMSPERGRELVISTQVLAESYAVVTRRLRVPLSAADTGSDGFRPGDPGGRVDRYGAG